MSIIYLLQKCGYSLCLCHTDLTMAVIILNLGQGLFHLNFGFLLSNSSVMNKQWQMLWGALTSSCRPGALVQSG